MTWLLLGGITVIGLLLRGIRLGESPGGFLVYNENFYLQLALQEQSRGFFAWFYNPLDLNNPPLFTALASTFLRFGGPIVASARLVSVLAGVAMIVFTFLLGRLLFEERTGLVAAAALAVMPGVVLVNHNIQVDSLFVALMLGGVFFFVRSVHDERMADAVAGGVLLGLALLTKQPAALALIALAIWRAWAQKGLAWLAERRTWAFAASSIGVGGSWYLFQLVAAPKRLFGAAVGVADRPDMLRIDSTFWSYILGSQLVWMVFPLAAAVAIAGLVVMARRRKSGDLLSFVFLAIYLVYYVGFHLHPYYLLPLAPFIAIAIGRACMGAFDRTHDARVLRVVGVSVLIASMAFGSVMMMSGQKWGRWSPMDLRPQAASGYSRVHVYYNPWFDGMYWSLAAMVDPQYSPTPATAQQYNALPTEPGVQDTYLVPRLFRPDGTRAPAREDLTETRIRVVLFGFAIGQRWDMSSRTQVFTNEPWTAERVGPWWRFGVQSTRVATNYSLY